MPAPSIHRVLVSSLMSEAIAPVHTEMCLEVLDEWTLTRC